MKRNILNTKHLILALVMMMTAAVSASAMSYEQARNEALFLTDKMAYELNLTDAQYEAAYEINLDYLMGVTSVDDVFGTYWERRNLDLSYILYSWQWDAFRAATYFYRPLYWDAGFWHFGIYAYYPRRDHFFFGRPHFYATYRGGHVWHMNGGRSYYHGHVNHFRPALPQGRTHFGMRNSLDRGDFRGSRAGSSTRITGRQGGFRDNRSTYGRTQGDNFNRSGSGNFNRSGSSDFNRSGSGNFNRSGSGNFNRSGSGNFNRSGSSDFNRSGSGNFNRSGSSDFNRSGSSMGNRPSSGSMGTRSVGGGSMGSQRPSSNSGSHGSGGGGHFGRVQR